MMAERIYKTWGQRFKLHEDDLSETCFLQLDPWQRCSYHVHDHKSNFFFVIDGELTIKTEWGTTIIKQYEFFTVLPGDFHEFQTHELPTRIVEVAFVKLAEDIKREELGGTLDGMPESISSKIKFVT